ncbi:MAG: hypothetical protein ABSA10_01580 [Anaerolineales bacterium]|jgi:hypothetical protein
MPARLASMGGNSIVFLTFLILFVEYLVIQGIPIGKKAAAKEKLLIFLD